MNSNSEQAPKENRQTWLRLRLPLLLVWMLLALLTIGALGSLGGVYGYKAGAVEAESLAATQASQSLVDQYSLGMVDLEAGRYDLARQRFEYVLENDPQFPGAADGLVEAMRVLYATATPTNIPPTITPTPTRDLRPIQDLLEEARANYAAGDWSAAINTLTQLRESDPDYEMVRVDSLIFRSLRNRGLAKIRDEGSLEGGIYDLTLAERFAPLDQEAESYRTLARLYVTGSGFWEVYPQQAAYYFGQVAAAAPYLSDASGWTAFERYRWSVLHYAEQFGREGDWCSAEEQYEAALRIRNDFDIQATATEAALLCSPPTNTPAPVTDTPTPTMTFTWTPTGTFVPAPTSTWTPSPTSGAPQVTATITPTPTSTQSAATPTETQPAASTPTDTQAPPLETPTETQAPPEATPTPTDTQAPPTEAPTAAPTETQAVAEEATATVASQDTRYNQ